MVVNPPKREPEQNMNLKKTVSICTVLLMATGLLASAVLAHIPCQAGCGGSCCQHTAPARNGFVLKSAAADCCKQIGATGCHLDTQKGVRYRLLACSGTPSNILPQPLSISGRPAGWPGKFDKSGPLGRDPANFAAPAQTPIYIQNLTFLI